MLQHTLAEQLRFNAVSFPERPALEVVGGPGLTYAEALDRTLVLATAIRERTDGSPVAILHRNSPDAALSFLACQLAGVPAVPVNNVLTRPRWTTCWMTPRSASCCTARSSPA
jgi:acyl-CoA synthetase (AMP-forming)/AMP-acid ligase II